MKFTAREIAALIGGKIQGSPEAAVTKIGRIEDAVSGDLSFIANPKYEHYLKTTGASVVIVSEELLQQEAPKTATLIAVADPYSAFAKLLETYEKMQAAGKKRGIEQPAVVSESAKVPDSAYVGSFCYVAENVEIGENVSIYPGCFIGSGVKIGKDTTIHAGVKIYHGCEVGERCILHAGLVIGSDGFGFAPQPDGSFKKVPQTGNVVIGNDVEIGANTTLDRATIGATYIQDGVKLDNLVQIAHNVEVGKSTVIAAQTGVSGSTKIGRGNMIGGQVGIVGHIQLADGTKINAQSGVAKSVTAPGTTLNGTPAFEYGASMKSAVVYRNLPQMQQQLRQLQSQMEMLQKTIESLSGPQSES